MKAEEEPREKTQRNRAKIHKVDAIFLEYQI